MQLRGGPLLIVFPFGEVRGVGRRGGMMMVCVGAYNVMVTTLEGGIGACSLPMLEKYAITHAGLTSPVRDQWKNAGLFEIDCSNRELGYLN